MLLLFAKISCGNQIARMNRLFFVGAFNQANLNVSSTRTMAGWAIGGEFKRHVERISDWILLASHDTRPYDTHNGRWTKQQSIKTKLGSVRRIPSIKLGTSKYLARRRKRTRKGEKVDRRGEFCAGWRGRHSSRGDCQELASISRIRTPETKSYPLPLFGSSSFQPLALFVIYHSRLLALPDTSSLKESSLGVVFADHVPIICPQNSKPPHEIRWLQTINS